MKGASMVTSAGPIIIAIASVDEKVIESVSAALPHEARLLPIAGLTALFSNLVDFPLDLLLIEEEFNGSRTADTLATIKKSYEDLVVLVILKEPEPQSVEQILQAGAFDILKKPLRQEEVDRKIQKGLEHVQLLQKVRLMEARKQASSASEQPLLRLPPADAGDIAGPLLQFFEASVNLQDLNKLMELLVSSLSACFLAGKAAAILYNENDGTLQVRSCRGLNDEFLRTIDFSVTSGIYSWLRKNLRFLSLHDLSKVGEGEQLAVMDKEARLLQAELIIPLLGSSFPLGFISLGNKFNGEPYSAEEMKGLFFLARQAGAAVENALLLQNTRGIAVRDHLTQLFSRYYWEKNLNREVERSKRYDRPLSVAIFDIDWFKRINDTSGHQAGDKVLSAFAKYLMKSSRHTDIIGRYGGEEFIAILPETTAELARVYGERLRQDVEQRLGAKENEDFIYAGLTVSGGITTCDRKNDTSARLIERADRALYDAKNQGRNRVNYLPPP
jgi:diguanylate cyclase (GGDEF)-like protein